MFTRKPIEKKRCASNKSHNFVFKLNMCMADRILILDRKNFEVHFENKSYIHKLIKICFKTSIACGVSKKKY